MSAKTHRPVPSRIAPLAAALTVLLALPAVARAAHHYVAIAPENERFELALDGSLRLNGAAGVTATATLLVDGNSAVQAWFNGGASDLYLSAIDPTSGGKVQGKSAKMSGGVRGQITTGRSVFLGIAGGLFLFNEKEYLGLDIAAFLGTRFGRCALTAGVLIDIMVLDQSKVGGSKGLTSQFSMRIPAGLIGYAEFDVLKGDYPGSYFAPKNLWLSVGVAKRF